MGFNKRQKRIVSNFVSVFVLTTLAVVGMINFKDYINRAEARRAMEGLSLIVTTHKEKTGQIPSEMQIDRIKSELPGSARIGQIYYRSRWIGFGATGDEILAYIKKNYNSIFGSGYIVLRYDGTVEWMKAGEFEELLSSQQSSYEKELQVTE